ncbi:hypothetical protein [Bradyrhizobium sp. WD16]|uniref:hypothetical protein n=1 Tax=Bradyrhizobium sp. WD16 TaxID=1521768 RepID=UPI0020A2B169|nr:hypothetical protein [Bradyrhizobium sp. WD16]UTD27806.1 hypothetical protein DB459_13660 [Bradyrhizobium sp. WD16]
MVNASSFLTAVRQRLAELKATDRNDRDISEMRALSELISVIDDRDLILWEHKGIRLLENAVAAYRPKEARPPAAVRLAESRDTTAIPCAKAVLQPSRRRPKRPSTH